MNRLKQNRAASFVAVTLAGAMRNFVMYGIECEDGAKMLSDQRTKR